MYKPTFATVIGKRVIDVVSSPGFFRDGGRHIDTRYCVSFKSDSGKHFEESFDYGFFFDLNIGDRIYAEGNRFSKINNTILGQAKTSNNTLWITAQTISL